MGSVQQAVVRVGLSLEDRVGLSGEVHEGLFGDVGIEEGSR